MHALDALGNPIRRKILVNLRETPLSVSELAARFPVSRPAISRHLRVLADGGLVEVHADGVHHRYAIRIGGFAPVREFLDQFWNVALTRLAELSKR